MTYRNHPTPFLLVVFLFLISHISFTQSLQNGWNLEDFVSIRDTIDYKSNNARMEVLWMNKPIAIRIQPDKIYQDSIWNLLNEKLIKSEKSIDYDDQLLIRNQAAQNCHSYALEQYFEQNNISGNQIFNSQTAIWPAELLIILNESFKKIGTVTPKMLKKRKVIPENGSLLVFRNKGNIAHHSVFYNQAYFTKNGMLPKQMLNSFSPLIKQYFDTELIEIYQLDQEKIQSFLKKN